MKINNMFPKKNFNVININETIVFLLIVIMVLI